MLSADHRKVEELFEEFKNASSEEEKPEIVKQICTELIVHATLEEEIFYPACRDSDVEDDMLDEAQVEHDGAKILIADLMQVTAEDEFYDAKVSVLSEYIKHHVGEEEEPEEGIFAQAEAKGVDLAELGERMATRKAELMEQAENGSLEAPRPLSFEMTLQQEESSEDNEMPGQHDHSDGRAQRGWETRDNR